MLSQAQIIRSLGEALSWLERELEWGAPLAELRHLTGRIGELYAAVLTRGQMATSVNQHGYDVVGRDGERISVKTITSSLRVPFTPSTLPLVDRIMIFRLRNDAEDDVSIETLLDITRPGFDAHLRHLANGEIDYPVRQARPTAGRPLDQQAVTAEGSLDGWTVRQYESGTIAVLNNDTPVSVVLPELRKIAARIGVDLRNGNGGERNTRQLGAAIIDAITNLT